MTAVPNLAMVETDCLFRIEQIRPIVSSGGARLETVLHLCSLFRRIGVVRLFLMGRPEHFLPYLQMSGQAFLAFLRSTGDEQKRTGKSAPWFDAVASGSPALAAEIARASRTTFHDGREYEVDFLYHWFLMCLISGDAPEGRLEAMLDRYTSTLDGDDDIRIEICRSLNQRDSERFNGALLALMEEERKIFKERHQKAQLDPDVFVTTAKLSVEGLALAALADSRGMTTQRDYPLMPSIARHWGRAVVLPHEAWLQ